MTVPPQVTMPMVPLAFAGVRYYSTAPGAEQVSSLTIVLHTVAANMRNLYVIDLVDPVQPGELLIVSAHGEVTNDAKNPAHPSGYAVDFAGCLGLVGADADFDTDVLFSPGYVIIGGARPAGENVEPVPGTHHGERYPTALWVAPADLAGDRTKIVWTGWADSTATDGDDQLTVMAGYGGLACIRITPDAYGLWEDVADGLPVVAIPSA